MKDKLQEKLVTYLGHVEGMANDAVLFGKQEIPLYLQELIRWEIAYNGILAAMWFAIGSACAYVVYRMIKGWSDLPCGSEPAIMFPIAATLGCFIGITVCTVDASKAYFAPRVLLVEKLSAMVKGGK